GLHLGDREVIVGLALDRHRPARGGGGHDRLRFGIGLRGLGGGAARRGGGRAWGPARGPGGAQGAAGGEALGPPPANLGGKVTVVHGLDRPLDERGLVGVEARRARRRAGPVRGRGRGRRGGGAEGDPQRGGGAGGGGGGAGGSGGGCAEGQPQRGDGRPEAGADRVEDFRRSHG